MDSYAKLSWRSVFCIFVYGLTSVKNRTSQIDIEYRKSKIGFANFEFVKVGGGRFLDGFDEGAKAVGSPSQAGI